MNKATLESRPASKRRKGLLALLGAYCLVLGIETGAGIFEALVVVPLWGESSAAAQRWRFAAPDVPEGGAFFAIFSPLLLLLTIVLAAASFRAPWPARVTVLISVGIVIVLMATTFAYYLPTQTALKSAESISGAAFAREARLWIQLNWVRQSAGVVAFAVAVVAFGRLYQSNQPTT